MTKLIKSFGISLFLLLPYFFVHGQASNCDPNQNVICNPLKGSGNLLAFLQKVLDIVIKLGAIIALIAIIYAGFLFVTAGGSDEKIKTAKKTILYTVLGTAIILGAKVILTVIEGTLKSLI